MKVIASLSGVYSDTNDASVLVNTSFSCARLSDIIMYVSYCE